MHDLLTEVQAAAVVEGGDGKPLEDGTKKLSVVVGLQSGALVHLTVQMRSRRGRGGRSARRHVRQSVWRGWRRWASEASSSTRGVWPSSRRASADSATQCL